LSRYSPAFFISTGRFLLFGMILITSPGQAAAVDFHPAGCRSSPHHGHPAYGSFTRLHLPTMPQIERSTIGLMEITGAHGRRPNHDAINLPPVWLIRFAQKPRSARTPTLGMSQRDL